MTSHSRPFLTAVLCGLFAFGSLPTAYAANDDLDDLQTKLGNQWVLVKNDQRRNIKTWAKQEDGKRYRSFKVEAILETNVESLARVLLDFDNYTRWFWKTREPKLIRQNSSTEYIVITQNSIYIVDSNIPTRKIN